jgi:hypothetical protein
MGLKSFLAAAMVGILESGASFSRPKIKPASGIKGHRVIGKGWQNYMTGQHQPSKRPVTRVQWDPTRQPRPHQGAQECARRVRQGLA